MSTTTAPPRGGFLYGDYMNIYIYSDESGVFDRSHHDYYLFGGIILLGNEQLEEWARRYSHTEKTMRKIKKVDKSFELKASNLTLKERSKLYRSLNNCYKFIGIIDEKKVLKEIFNNKKDKQRYLDFAYKVAIKNSFEELIELGAIIPSEVKNIKFDIDEHSTATSGRYELEQTLEQELKTGKYDWNWSAFYPPLFPSVNKVSVTFSNSEFRLLVRAADIIVNKAHFYVVSNNQNKLNEMKNTFITHLP